MSAARTSRVAPSLHAFVRPIRPLRPIRLLQSFAWPSLACLLVGACAPATSARRGAGAAEARFLLEEQPGQSGHMEVARVRARTPGETVLRVRWRRLLTEPSVLPPEYKPQEFASPATDGHHVFVGSGGGKFWALSPKDGRIVWHAEILGGVGAQPLYLADPDGGGPGTVFVGGNDGAMRALDAATGHEKWKYQTKGPIGGAPVYDDGALYFANGENRVYCIDAATGKWRWQYDRETPDSFTIRGFAGPLVYGGRVYAGFADGYLVAMSAKGGDVLWARSLAGDAQRFVDVDATPTIVDGTLYAASYSGGVVALDPADGAVKWRYDVEGASSVRVSRGRVYFAAAKAGLHCLDTAGRLLWRQSLAAMGELSPPVLVGDRYIFLSAADGGTYVVDQPSGRLLQFFDPGHGVTSEPATDGSQVYILTNTGFLYAFSLDA